MGSTSGIQTASEIQLNYMKLLITQLKNQNPMDPMSNDQMAAQLAQFAQLSQLESMNLNFAKTLAFSTFSYANSLIGKEVSYLRQNGLTGAVEKQWGKVGEVYGVDGENVLIIDRQNLSLKEVADSLVGKDVLFHTATGKVMNGTVHAVQKDINGPTALVMQNGDAVDLEDIIAESLINQDVSFVLSNEETGALEDKTAAVSEVYKDANGESILVVGNFLELEDVISIKN